MSDDQNRNLEVDDLDYDMARDDENHFAADDDDGPVGPTSTIADIDDYEDYDDAATPDDVGDDEAVPLDGGDDEDDGLIAANAANRPKKSASGNKKSTLLFAGVAVFALLGVGGYFALSGGGGAPMEEPLPVTAMTDPMAQPDPNAPPVDPNAPPIAGAPPVDPNAPPIAGAPPVDPNAPPVDPNAPPVAGAPVDPNDPMGIGGQGVGAIDPNAPITDAAQLPAPTAPANAALPTADAAAAAAALPVIADAAVPNTGAPAVLEEVPSTTDGAKAGASPADTLPVMPGSDAATPPAASAKKGDDFYDTGDVIDQLADMSGSSAGPGLPPASEFVVVTRGGKSSSTSTLTDLGQRALDAGRNQAAADLFGDAVMRNSGDRNALLGRAIANQRLGKNDQAIKDYQRLLTVSPGNKEALINLSGLIRQEDPALATSRLASLQEDYPDNDGIVAQKALMLADQGNFANAAAQLEKAITLAPDNPMHYYNRAIVAERMADKRSAIEYYERALDVDATHASGRRVPRDKIYDRLTVLRQ